jgi:outer membrane protein assembly factor BamB
VRGAALLALLGGSVPSRPHPQSAAPRAEAAEGSPSGLVLIGGLEVGLAGPPVLGRDGSWWLLGRDGEVERFGRNDRLAWSISVAAAVMGSAVADEDGVLYVPTARDLVFAIEPSGHVRWRFRAPNGVAGPICWVSGQGLVFLGLDGALYWLDRRANLVLRVALDARVSAGPIALGSKALVGTEKGHLVAVTRQGRRQTLQLAGAVTALTPFGNGALALAATRAVAVDPDLRLTWSRDAVLGIAVTAAHGQQGSQGTPVLLTDSGRIEWLDAAGQRQAESPLDLKVPAIAGIAATATEAWVAQPSGRLLQVGPHRARLSLPIARGPLVRPVLDTLHSRLLIGSEQGTVWSLPIGDIGLGTAPAER